MSDKSPDADSNGPDSFESYADQDQPGLFAEFWDFLRYNKKWWLIPILLTLLVLGVFVVLSGTALAPFIYTMF